jgi:glycosyltransferase involved in cell wall biosynthesis
MPAKSHMVMPLGDHFGWGICGMNIALELAKLGAVDYYTDWPAGTPFPGSTESQASLAKIVKSIPKSPELGIYIDDVVLRAAPRKLDVFAPEITAKTNVWYTFFEESLLHYKAYAAAWHGEKVLTGSKWCTEVLQSAGVTDCDTVIQGIDHNLFHPLEAQRSEFQDKFVVFSGGKFELRKGQDLVLAAWKKFSSFHDDVLLINAWSSPWPKFMKTMQRSPWLKMPEILSVPGSESNQTYAELIMQVYAANDIDHSSIVTLPNLPQNQFAHIYHNTDLGLFPNRCEGGTNLVLMEYMACGKPVIGGYSSGQRDVLDPECSILLEPEATMILPDKTGEPAAEYDDYSVELIVDALEYAYENRDDIQELGQKAHVHMKQFTWAQTAAQFKEHMLKASQGL